MINYVKTAWKMKVMLIKGRPDRGDEYEKFSKLI